MLVESVNAYYNQSVKLCHCGRYKKDAQMLGQLSEPAFHEELRESVLTAERALLYALGFQLNIDHPHYFATHVVSELARIGGAVGDFWAAFGAKHVFGPHGNVRAPLLMVLR